ncbi:MAG TPA: DUF3576 domain-containing protein [Alphaproteobacteria bacterium]|nr:DUF3576 domain-containing protein [Alphaproteobacteria bacterium]
MTASRLISLSFCLLVLAGCEGVQKEASYPTRPKGTDKIVYSDQQRETIWGDGKSLGSKLFGFGNEDTQAGGGAGIGVNSFLWRASLDTISFMPIASADPFGGVILTDWYENPDQQGERYKLNIYILDRQLRADGLRVAAFKQTREKDGWRDVGLPADMSLNLENAILTRARELRVGQMGGDQ